MREEINTVKNNIDMLMEELTNFVDTNFPPQDCEGTEVRVFLVSLHILINTIRYLLCKIFLQ
jgi:hypothetical protein